MVLHVFAHKLRGTRGMQYVAVLIASLAATAVQLWLSWPSPSLSKLKGDDSPLGKPLSGEEASWIVSIPLLASLPASLTYHMTAARFGRKQVLQIASLTLFLPWLLLIFGDHFAYLLVARGVAGSVVAVTLVTVSMYCSEVADPDIRGRLGTFYGVMKVSGNFLVLSIGPFISYTALSMCCAAVTLVLLCLLFFIPESPYQLAKMNRLEEARASVIVLSGSDADSEIDARVNAIIEYVHVTEHPWGVIKVFSNRACARVLCILITIIILEHLIGFNAILVYQQEIIASSASIVSPEISSIAFAFAQLPGVVLSAFLVDRLGRKVILYIGCTGCLIALVAEGVYFFLADYQRVDVSSLSWLPTTALVTYLISHSVHSCVPYILVGELFTDQAKNVATTSFTTTAAVATFVVSKSFESIRDVGGLYTVMWTLAFFALCTILATYFLLIETKNMTFKEIEQKVCREYEKNI